MTLNEFVSYVMDNNHDSPKDRFYIKKVSESHIEIHDNYDEYYSCGLILKDNKFYTRSYSEMQDAPITESQALTIGKNFFGVGCDYANDLVIEYTTAGNNEELYL
jgi:hypothetical protein